MQITLLGVVVATYHFRAFKETSVRLKEEPRKTFWSEEVDLTYNIVILNQQFVASIIIKL